MKLSKRLEATSAEIVKAREKFYSTLEEGVAKLIGCGNDKDANGEPVYTLPEDQRFTVLLKDEDPDNDYEYRLQAVSDTGITAGGFDFDWKYVETASIMEIVRFLESLQKQN